MRSVGRAIGLDVHRDFCEVAIAEDGEVRSCGRIATTPEQLELFGASLGPRDRVALEVTGSAWEVARILEPHVARVVVVSPADTGIRQARAKTDRLDARALARLLAAGQLDAVWSPDEACMRHIEFLDCEIAAVERQIASEVLHSADIRRLMTVPGVNVICAATFMAAIGDIRRFPTSRKLVGYLGLDPRVYQSGSTPATGGRISKQGSPSARWALVEAAWSVLHQPGPLHAFYARIRARRSGQVAAVAVARKLACLFWCLLTRGEDYAHQQPSLTAKKLRLLEIRAGAPTAKGKRTGTFATRQAMREGERQLAQQAEASYTRMVRDWQAATPASARMGASVTPGRASQKPSKGKVARQTTSP